MDHSATWHRATVRDLSAGGATLIAPEKIAPETILHLRFRLPRQDPDLASPIEVETVVLRADALSSSGGNVQYREALHFLDLRGTRFDQVRRFIFERQAGEVA